MPRQPVLFVSHGAPTFALEPGIIGAKLTELGQRLSRPQAVLVVSAHWVTRGLAVSSNREPETIHDFSGFPQALYDLRYFAAGHPQLAAQTAELLGRAGWPARLDPHRGLDHGAWVPLLYLYPEGDVPVFQVSPPYPLDSAGALGLGRHLAPLREQGVLILASGSLTHNLYEYRRHGQDEPYVKAFADWVGQTLQRNDSAALLDYRRQAPEAERAHPGEDHLLPLLVAQGARQPDDALEILPGGIADGVLAMDAYLFDTRKN